MWPYSNHNCNTLTLAEEAEGVLKTPDWNITSGRLFRLDRLSTTNPRFPVLQFGQAFSSPVFSSLAISSLAFSAPPPPRQMSGGRDKCPVRSTATACVSEDNAFINQAVLSGVGRMRQLVVQRNVSIPETLFLSWISQPSRPRDRH